MRDADKMRVERGRGGLERGQRGRIVELSEREQREKVRVTVHSKVHVSIHCVGYGFP